MTVNLTRPAGPPDGGIDDLYRQHAIAMVRLALLLTGDRSTGHHEHWGHGHVAGAVESP